MGYFDDNFEEIVLDFIDDDVVRENIEFEEAFKSGCWVKKGERIKVTTMSDNYLFNVRNRLLDHPQPDHYLTQLSIGMINGELSSRGLL